MYDSDHFEDGVRSGREASPQVEYAFQDAVTAAVRTLFEERGLYQNVRIDDRFCAIFPVVPNQDYKAEFSKRPLYLFSRGSTERDGGLPRHTGSGLGTPHDEMDVGCYLPEISTHCPACADQGAFVSLSASNAHFMSPYPRISEQTEQIYSPLYKCTSCRNQLINFQVLRKGYKLQLTGRSVPYRPKVDSGWPASIRPVVEDAFAAASEGDIAAGYYHLRTALEFLMKDVTGVPVPEKIDGTDLCRRYNEILDQRLRRDFPSASQIYSSLSAGMHTRVCTQEELRSLANRLLDHLNAKALFEKYSG